MHSHRFSNLLMRPSLFSGSLCALAAIAIPIAVNWSYVLQNFLFYDYFFGPGGLMQSLQVADAPVPARALGQTLSSSELQHALSIIFGALMSAFILFCSFKLISHLVGTVNITIREMHAVETPAKHEVERELGRRVVIRLVVLAVWAVYIMISLKAILPFAVLSSQIGLSGSSSISTGIYYTLFSGLLLFFALHGHIMMARLFMLRPRVFGGEDDIIGS